MREFTLEHYEDKLNHQVIHMDQAVCYCPEFRASHMPVSYTHLGIWRKNDRYPY